MIINPFQPCRHCSFTQASNSNIILLCTHQCAQRLCCKVEQILLQTWNCVCCAQTLQHCVLLHRGRLALAQVAWLAEVVHSGSHQAASHLRHNSTYSYPGADAASWTKSIPTVPQQQDNARICADTYLGLTVAQSLGPSDAGRRAAACHASALRGWPGSGPGSGRD